MEFSRARPSDPFYRERERLEGERRTQAKAMYTIYEQQWSRLATMNELRWDSFPWPTPTMPSTPVEITPAAIRGYILSSDFPESTPPRPIAERVKEHIHRWHPDHLDRGLFARVIDADREIVTEGLWAVTIGLKDIQRDGVRGKQEGWSTSGRSLGDIEARRREVELRQRELGVHKIEEAAKRMATEAQLLAEESQTNLELARVMEEEVRMKEEEIKRREEETKKRAEEIKRREEETKKRTEDNKKRTAETKMRAEEIKRREEETRKRAEETKRREEEAKRRTEEVRMREEEIKMRADEGDHRGAQARAVESERERGVEEKFFPGLQRPNSDWGWGHLERSPSGLGTWSNYEREWERGRDVEERWVPTRPSYEQEREQDVGGRRPSGVSMKREQQRTVEERRMEEERERRGEEDRHRGEERRPNISRLHDLLQDNPREPDNARGVNEHSPGSTDPPRSIFGIPRSPARSTSWARPTSVPTRSSTSASSSASAQPPIITTTPPGPPASTTTSIPPPPPPPPPEESWTQRQAEFAERQRESFRREQERLEIERQARLKRTRTPERAINPIFADHQRQWEVLSALSELRWDAFPWPMLKAPSGPHEITLAAINAYIISPDRDGTQTTRDRVKEHLRRWHPDRFETKLLGKVVAAEQETVKVGAAVVARSLNMILTQLNASIYT